MMDIIGFDKDSVLADTSQRHWMVPCIKAGIGSPLNPRNLTWDDYSRACADDKPIEASRELMRLLAPHYPLYVMSGSSDCPEARRWLIQHRFPYSQAFFRPEDDHCSNGAIKVKWIKSLQEAGYRVRLFVEDWIETAEAIESVTGVPCLVLNPRYESRESSVQ